LPSNSSAFRTSLPRLLFSLRTRLNGLLRRPSPCTRVKLLLMYLGWHVLRTFFCLCSSAPSLAPCCPADDHAVLPAWLRSEFAYRLNSSPSSPAVPPLPPTRSRNAAAFSTRTVDYIMQLHLLFHTRTPVSQPAEVQAAHRERPRCTCSEW